jgi:hypothetical protein
MANFAKIGLDNRVIEVISVNNEVLKDADGVEQESKGIEFLTQLTGHSIWKQTSINTHGNVHILGGTPLRKNYAGIGYSYDADRDAFIAERPFASWLLNETTCLWDAPIPRPELTDEQISQNIAETHDWYYSWNESNTSWDLINGKDF